MFSSSEVIPIFMTRLVEDRGGIIQGGLAQVGKLGEASARRSCTSCLASYRSVSLLKRSSICERSVTDLERISSSPGIPFSWFSSGTVISSSTCSEELPTAMVWISTRGGANSGKTSRSALRVSPMPNTISAAATKSTSHRNRKLDPTIQRIRHPYLSMCDLELGAVHLGGPDRHDLGTGGWTVGEYDAITVHVVDTDLLAHIGQRLRSRVGVRVATGVIDDGVIGYERCVAVLTNRGRLEADSLRRFGVEYNALDVRSLDRLELGWLVMACRLVVIARTCLAASGKRYYAGDQDKTRAGGTQLPPALTGGGQPSHSSRIASEHIQTPRARGAHTPSSARRMSSLMQWMTYWRLFFSRSLGAQSPKNVLLISSSRSSRVGSYLLGTWTLLLTVFRSGITPLLREAKRGDPYSRKTAKKGRSSQAVANDGRTTAKEHNAPCL